VQYPNSPRFEGFFYCSKKGEGCNYRYWPPELVFHAQLAMDIISEETFRVRGGAEK
jgi:hypothetical protein